eukprot:77943-Rhodomonas_salina.1
MISRAPGSRDKCLPDAHSSAACACSSEAHTAEAAATLWLFLLTPLTFFLRHCGKLHSSSGPGRTEAVTVTDRD